MAKKTKKRNKKVSRLALTWHQLKKNKIAMISLIILLIIIVVAILAPLIAPYSYEFADRQHLMEGSSPAHLLGTDRQGRDVLSRLIWGSRNSMIMGLGCVALGTVSKVFNGIPVGKSYRERVEAAAERLGYSVNSYARGLRASKTNTIALILPCLEGWRCIFICWDSGTRKWISPRWKGRTPGWINIW